MFEVPLKKGVPLCIQSVLTVFFARASNVAVKVLWYAVVAFFLVFSCLCKAKRNLWRHIKGEVVGSIIVLTNVGL